jgi:3-methyladenine DNA glycosylase/8-oxoguanine DNA glycosylase
MLGVMQRDVWRAGNTPDGPGTVHIGYDGRVQTWGPGGDWLRNRVPAMTGALDRLDGFDPSPHPLVAELARQMPFVRLTRTERVLDALVPLILEQKVTGVQARRSWAGLLRVAGEQAPGPRPMRCPPTAARLLDTPTHVFHRLGVERKRAETIHRCAAVAHRLEEAVALGVDVLDQRLQSIGGVGVWTSAAVRLVAMGDPDAVRVGDYHLKNTVAWALAGEPRADDERMVELLEPFRGHRARVVRLIECAGIKAPRRGPRLAPMPIASL